MCLLPPPQPHIGSTLGWQEDFCDNAREAFWRALLGRGCGGGAKGLPEAHTGMLIMQVFSTPGPNCQTNINECASNPCLNQGTCIDDVAGYQCSCLLPYTGKRRILSHSGQPGTANRVTVLRWGRESASRPLSIRKQVSVVVAV